jgi:DNA modification methylase
LLGLILWDLPYGLGKESWDKSRLSITDLKQVFNQLRVILSHDGAVMVAWCHFPQIGEMFDAMKSGGFQDVHTYYWYKKDQNVATGTKDSYTFSVETAVMGYYGGRSKCKFRHFSSNPAERHNIHMSFTHRDLYQYKGKVVNLHEKPISLAAVFVKQHTDEGDKCLVLGSGCGSELIACVELGRPVVGIELDPSQYEAANDRLRSWWTRVTSNQSIWHANNLIPSADDQSVRSYPNSELWGIAVEGRVGTPGSCWTCGDVSLQETMDQCV